MASVFVKRILSATQRASRARPTIALLALGFLLFATGGVAGADETTPRPLATASDVRAALGAFARASRSKVAEDRIEAVRALGARVHSKIAKRLLKFAHREQDAAVLAATFTALAAQVPFAKTIVPKLAARIAAEAQSERKRMARGDAGIRIDPRSGEPDVDSAAGRARLRAVQQRSGMLLALMTTLSDLGWEAGKSPPDLTPLLQDASDDLVVAVLAWMGRARVEAALPAVLDLYRMYPTEASWETGAVIDLAGTDASAKAKWMVRFGHPDKQRARPRVHRAIRDMLLPVTGQRFETPAALAQWLGAQDEKARGRSARRKR